ncbi:protein kinase-like protein [Pochonia chlamydosporia 170]|uniref:Protein kinase-like protein n=1 Tax=Pochonia chlamydosporia 170 TaxID=1380566 RepID=A0A179FI41_METCM|nr:protein kinase-like protein [Pochonia chlamydosporia 170]OAQ65097.1 protein kinase-like protein [Pochonia chlamydosporia 170]
MNKPVTKSSILEDGCEGTTFERKYYHSGMSYIKRSLRREEFKEGYYGIYVPRLSKERLQNEAACLRFISRATSIPVPRVFADFEDAGAYYLITEFIDGVSMSELSEEDKVPVRKELEKYLHILHNLKSNVVGGPSGLVVAPRPVMENTDQDLWVLQPSETDEFVFCHNDLSEYNIIVDPKELTIRAIIDWEYAGYYPEFFEAPIYTRHGPNAQVTNDDGLVSRMLEFLRTRELKAPILAKESANMSNNTNRQ